MTRKDYEVIADRLHLYSRSHGINTANKHDAFTAAVLAVCDALIYDNPRFDKDRFIEAVAMPVRPPPALPPPALPEMHVRTRARMRSTSKR